MSQEPELELDDAFRAVYRLEQLLGSGTSGAVYRAYRIADSQMVAIKFLTRDSDEAIARFDVESKLLARISHPNFVRGFETGKVGPHRYLVTEYVAGGTLRRHVKAGRLSIKDAARIVCDVLAGLEACHAAGIVHRDLKPDNILLTVDGAAKVADLGLARRVDEEDTLTKAGAVLGTPRYMAPEQVRGEPAGTAADVYSAGLVLYEALAGVYPYEAPTSKDLLRLRLDTDPPPLGDFVTGVPPAVTTLVAKAMSREPALRPSAKAFGGALAAAAKRVATDSRAIAVPGAKRAKSRERERMGVKEGVMLGAALAFGALAFIGGLWLVYPALFQRSAVPVELVPSVAAPRASVAVRRVTTAAIEVELPGGQVVSVPPPATYPVALDGGHALEAGAVADALCHAVREMDGPLAAAGRRGALEALHVRTGAKKSSFAPAAAVRPHLDAVGLTPHAALLERHARAVLASPLSSAHRRKLETRVNQLLDLALWMRAYFLTAPFDTALLSAWPPTSEPPPGSFLPIEIERRTDGRRGGEPYAYLAAAHDLLGRPIHARREMPMGDPEGPAYEAALLRFHAPRQLTGRVQVPPLPAGAVVYLVAGLIPDVRHSVLVRFDGSAPVRLALAERPPSAAPGHAGYVPSAPVAQRLPPGLLRPGSVPVEVDAVVCEPYDDALSTAFVGSLALVISNP